MSFSLCQRAVRPPTASSSDASSFSSLLEPVLRRGIGFLLQRLLLDLELHEPAVDFVEFFRLRIDLHAQARRRLIDQVDRLVGQKAVGDVAVRKDAAATSAESVIRTP